MARILGIGDNTIDMYVDQGVQYPGGNAVNVAVMSSRLGAHAAYLGCIGSDDLGDILRNMLKSEKIDTSHLRCIDQPNAWSAIQHVDGDRVFDGVSFSPTKPEWYQLDADDFRYVAEFDLAHTSIYSKLDHDLPKITKAAKVLSFDYSDVDDLEYFEKTAPFVDIAFLSKPDTTDEACERLCADIAQHGPSIVVVTRGDKGSMAYDGTQLVSQAIVPGHIVDTLGAGDGLIAGFLVAHLSGATLSEALKKGAENATFVCGYRGGLGYETKIQPGLSKT